MHLCRPWIAFGLLAILAAPLAVEAAVVYKWTDADGVVHFSDQPMEGAEKIITASGAAHTGFGGSSANGGSKQKAAASATPAPTDSQFIIDSPAAESTITGNQPVTAHLSMVPVLKPGQIVSWSVNGSPMANTGPDPTQLTLTDLDRGTYTLTATMIDQVTGDSKTAAPVTFYVMRTSLLSPQRKAP